MRNFLIGGLASLLLASCGQTPPDPANPPDQATSQAAANDVARPFTQAAFDTARQENKPILVDVYAGWCPVCARQQPAIASAAADGANRDLVVLKLDYDSQKAEQAQFGIQRQSTLIAFRGARETGRLVGETDPERIAALIASTRG